MNEPISVLVIDDHRMFGAALATALEEHGGLTVVGVGNSIREAHSLLDQHPVDVLLLDQRLPDGRGTEAVSEFHARHPHLRVLMLSASDDEAVIAEAFLAGCAGYITKSETIEYVAAAVRNAHAGATSLSLRLLERLTSTAVGRSSSLTPRELSILSLMAEGMPTNDICSYTSITRNTLRNHTQNILSKLGAHSKLEAVTQAIREGIVSGPGRDGP